MFALLFPKMTTLFHVPFRLLANSPLELGHVLCRHVDRRPAAAKDEAEELDSVRFDHLALLLVDDQA